jgi:hypothetical protein
MAAWLLEMLLRKMNFGGAWFDQEATDKEGYEEHWGATEEEDTEETERQPSLYDKEMTESFGTIYRGPISPPDPNNPEDYHEKVRQSLWAFKTGSFPDTVH